MVTTPQYALPPDTRAFGTPDPGPDTSNMVRALVAVGAASTILSSAFGGGADPTGSADSTAAFQAAFAGGGTVVVPPGTYKVDTAQLYPVSGLHLIGPGYEAATINCTGGGAYFMTFDGAGGLVEDVRIEGLTISATGMHIFSGAYMQRCQVANCRLIQNSADHAIFEVSGGNALMQECLYASNAEYVYGATRTVEAWHLDFSQPGGQSCNDNMWDYRGRKIFPANTSPTGDTAMYWMKFIGTGTGSAGSRGNRFRNLCFELRYGTGGLMHFQNVNLPYLDNITSEDMGSFVPGGPLLAFDGIGGTDGCTAVTVRGYSRRGGSGVSDTVPDIKFSQYCSQVTIEAPGQASGGAELHIDLADASNVKLEGAWPSSHTLLNAAGVVPGSPASWANLNPVGTTSTTQVMMGLGATAAYTPVVTGKFLVNVTGFVAATGATTATVGARYGTGTAPANGDGGTGSNVGGGVVGIATSGMFAFNAMLSLTAGTAYWFDLVAKTGNASYTVTATLATFTIMPPPS